MSVPFAAVDASGKSGKWQVVYAHRSLMNSLTAAMTGRYPIPYVSRREKLLLRRFAAGQAMQPHEARRAQECGAMIDEISKPQSYDSLRKQLRGVVTDLLDRVRDQAANEAERREIIDVYVAQITEIIEDTAMTTEQAFGIIDMIAADLKSDWEEMRASEPISRAAARKT